MLVCFSLTIVPPRLTVRNLRNSMAPSVRKRETFSHMDLRSSSHFTVYSLYSQVSCWCIKRVTVTPSRWISLLTDLAVAFKCLPQDPKVLATRREGRGGCPSLTWLIFIHYLCTLGLVYKTCLWVYIFMGVEWGLVRYEESESSLLRELWQSVVMEQDLLLFNPAHSFFFFFFDVNLITRLQCFRILLSSTSFSSLAIFQVCK